MIATYTSKIDISFGKLEEIIEWCEVNCRGPWTYSVIEDAGREPGRYRFFFDYEEDKINFILWKT